MVGKRGNFMSANFTPNKNKYGELGQFRYWCQKVLPLVYDDSLSYYELLCKVVNYLNETIKIVELAGEDVDNLHTAYVELETYVNNYYANLDVQHEINNKLNVMAGDGSLSALIQPFFGEYKEEIDAIVLEQNNMLNTMLEGIVAQHDEIGVLKERMNSFTTLAEGSTTGDAELADIRVGADGVTYSSAGEAVRTQFSKVLKWGGNAYDNGYNFDLAPEDKFLYVGATDCVNSPESDGNNFTFGFLSVYKAGEATFQLYVSHASGKLYIRYKANEGWTPWITVNTDPSRFMRFSGTNDGVEGFDFNTHKGNVFQYVAAFNCLNAPEKDANGFTFGFLMYYVSGEANFQTYISMNTGKMYIRYQDMAGNWTPWVNDVSESKEITVSSAEELYTNVMNMGENTHIYIKPGVYDISAFIEADNNAQMNIGNNCIVEGLGDVTIKCHLVTPSSVPSIFNFSTGNGEIKNLTLEGSNIRYIVHDECGGPQTTPGTHKITNCVLKYTGNGWADFTYPRCVGGGNGNDVVTIIEDCILEDTNDVCIDYHSNFIVLGEGSPQPTHGAKVIIRNCYSETSKINFSTLEQDAGEFPVVCLVSNDYMKEPLTASGVAYVVKQWNNSVVD